MNDHEILFRGVGFAYDTSATTLFTDLDLHLPLGWTGIVGANGAGKTTLLRLAIGELAPRQGQVHGPASALYCAQRTDEPPPLLAQFLAAAEAEACQLRGRLGIWMAGARSHRRALFTLPAGTLPLGEDRHLSYPDLSMGPDQRIALTGPNGGGKSTLVRRIIASLSLPEGQVVYLPQELPLSTAKEVLDRVRALPRDQLGKLMSVVSCLGSRPQRLLDTVAPSPGEARKLLLALGIVQTPHLIVMDEPTNHLDLPSIQCLEEALAECPCGVLLVSHDLPFLARLARIRWQLEEHEGGEWVLQVGEMPALSSV